MRAGWKPLIGATILLSAVPLSSSPQARAEESVATEVTATPIRQFRLDSAETRFGQLEFLGGLVLDSGNRLFGALSSIRFRPDGQHFAMVLDTGHWLTGHISRDAEGRLSGLQGVRITSMEDRTGRSEANKFDMDSESLSFRGNDVLVSFERRHRVDVYPGPDFEHARPVRTIPILIPGGLMKDNGSLETLAVAPDTSPLQGSAVIVAERSFDRDGNLYGAILEGPLRGRFQVRHHDGFDVSDGTFLPNGDLVLLERRFTLATGMGLRIVRIKGGDIKPDALVDGEILLEADMGNQIDNMEGIDAVRAADGSTHLILVSDDNHSLLQRSLMLEFKLLDQPD